MGFHNEITYNLNTNNLKSRNRDLRYSFTFLYYQINVLCFKCIFVVLDIMFICWLIENLKNKYLTVLKVYENLFLRNNLYTNLQVHSIQLIVNIFSILN